MADVGEPAVGQHGRELLAEAELPRRVLDAVQLPAHGIGGVGFDRRGIDALVLADHRAYVRGQVDGQLLALRSHFLAADRRHPFLVVGIGIGMQEADREALDVLCNQFARRAPRVRFVQRNGDVAEHVGALGDAAHAPPRDQRLVVHVGRGVQAVGVGITRPHLSPLFHLQDVLEALRGHEADALAGTRQQRVQHRGTGIDRHFELRERAALVELPLTERIARGFGEALGFVPRRGGCLADDEVPCAVDDEGVGHRAPGIHRHGEYLA